jgi:iron(III) transport system substrate-binding protein
MSAHPAAWLLALLTACGSPGPRATDPQAEVEIETVIVYSGRGESLIGPLIPRMEQALGLVLEVQYGDTPEVVTRLMIEGSETLADVILVQDSGHLGALAGSHILAPLPSEILESVDPRFRDPEGTWVGTSGRLRVLVYNTKNVSPDELPSSLKDLADPRWKGRLGWAPTNGSFQAHVSALRHAWGEQETRTWLEGVIANEPSRYPKNSPQVTAAASGEIDLGWVNHYYLHRFDQENFIAANHSFSNPEDMGNVLMVAGAGVRSGTPHQAAAERVVAWLAGAEAQAYFANEVFEYPTRPGVPTHAAVPPLDEVGLATVDQPWLADLGPTRTLLRDLGLL